jgi:hypothetical protein
MNSDKFGYLDFIFKKIGKEGNQWPRKGAKGRKRGKGKLRDGSVRRLIPLNSNAFRELMGVGQHMSNPL